MGEEYDMEHEVVIGDVLMDHIVHEEDSAETATHTPSEERASCQLSNS